MVAHEVSVSGVTLAGVNLAKPAICQINDDAFPRSFLQDLAAIPQPKAPAVSTAVLPAPHTIQLPTLPSVPVTLFQPVQRITHLALVELNCVSAGNPRLDPKRVLSAGLVIRRVPQQDGYDNLAGTPSPWVKDSQGNFSWILGDPSHVDDDPDPTQRPVPSTGQPALDQMLAIQAQSSAGTESCTPAFAAAPDVCNAAQRTLVYAVIPTASSEAASQPPPPPQYQNSDVSGVVPILLKAGSHSFPHANQPVDYRYMSDDYARGHNATDFLPFSFTLRTMYSAFGAFDNTPGAAALLGVLHNYNVTVVASDGSWQQVPMDQFYQQAASALIDYDPNANPGQQAPQITMPISWDFISSPDGGRILTIIGNMLSQRSALTLTPQGRYQDPTRLYRLRVFVRIKPDQPGCPPQTVWSCFSDPFHIAAWHESGGRVVPPVVLPDPTNPNVLQSLKNKPNSSFAVPAGLMNAMQSATMSGLSSGSAGGGTGGGISLNWICGFSIPLITICAFFVLNIFLTLLNIVFFWLPFIKICIPLPAPSPPGAQTGSQP
jgi:hypothetical protein